MRFERHNPGLTQAMLLALGALLVLLPLLAMAEQKQVFEKPMEQEAGAEAPSVVALSNEDLTKAGVSKVEVIFILRQERGDED
jgi:hypothetical protein